MALEIAQYQIDPSLVSPLEYQTLQEYAKLLNLLRHLLDQIYKLKNLNSQQLLDNLRILETKLTLVFTLFKGSVYSLFLQTKMNMSSNNNNTNNKDDDINSGNNDANDSSLKDNNDTSSSINSGY